MAFIIGLIIALGMVAIAFVYDVFSWGFVFYKLWYWFVLTAFVGLPAITLTQAIGLMIFLGLFKNFNIPMIKDEFLAEKKNRFWSLLLLPWVTLLVGYLVKIIFY